MVEFLNNLHQGVMDTPTLDPSRAEAELPTKVVGPIRFFVHLVAQKPIGVLTLLDKVGDQGFTESPRDAYRFQVVGHDETIRTK